MIPLEYQNKINELTPVEKYRLIFLKRDDKFRIGLVNGGKLRQALWLIGSNYDKIVQENNSSVVSASSIKSPQSGIIATVCKILYLNCNIVVYGTKEKNINLTIAKMNGAKIYGTKSGYNSVIEAYAKKNFGNNFFTNMGFASKDILDINSYQVQNIPDGLDYLIIPVGSGMNFISILNGLEMYKKNVKNIIGIYVGKDPKDNIKKYYNGNLSYKLIKYDKSYGTAVNIDNWFFDPIYEAKAYDWLVKNIDVYNNKVLLWVVGRRNLELIPTGIYYANIDERRKIEQ